MIFRYSITTLCMLALASISIAMTQKPEPGEGKVNELALTAPSRIAGSFELVLTVKLIDDLRKNGELVAKVDESVTEHIRSIKILHQKNGAASFLPRLPIVPEWIERDDTLVFRFSDGLLNHLNGQQVVYEVPYSYRGKCKRVKLTWQKGSRYEERQVDPFAQRPAAPLAQRPVALFAQREEDPFAQREVDLFAQRQMVPPIPPRVPVRQLDKETAHFNSILAQLTQQLKATESESEKVDLQDEIRDLLESEYDRHLDKQDAKLVEMQQRLEKLRAQYKKQKDAKDKLVEMRMTSIVSDAEGLGWPTDRQRNPWGYQWRPSLSQPSQNFRPNPRNNYTGPQFEPTLSPALPRPAYTIRIGDTLGISSAMDSSLNQEAVSVLSDGMISLPLIGQIRAAGANIAALQQQLDARYSKYVKKPAITVQVVSSSNWANRGYTSPRALNKSSRKPTETTATNQTKFWLQGMAELAKAGNWDALKKMGLIVLTYKDNQGKLAAVNLKKQNDLLAQALESAAEQKLYYRGFNRLFIRLRWNIKLDEEKYKLHFITGQKDYSTTSAVVMSKFINADLMQEKIKSKLADNDADNDSVEIQFDNEERLIILSGDSGAVKEAEEVVKEMMDHSKSE